MPVLSWSLIDDRTEAPRLPGGPRSNGNPQRSLNGTEFVPEETCPGPPVDAPASCTKPDHPDPQSQSLSRSYGSNLPTSLTYIILSTRGFSPWRPAADMGTSWCESAVISPGFSRSQPSLVDVARTATLFAKSQNPFSLREDSRASAAYAEKTTLSRARLGVSWSCRVATTDTRVRTVPLPGSGIWTRFPFG